MFDDYFLSFLSLANLTYILQRIIKIYLCICKKWCVFLNKVEIGLVRASYTIPQIYMMKAIEGGGPDSDIYFNTHKTDLNLTLCIRARTKNLLTPGRNFGW
jgi:hypothetical protein